MVENNDNLCSIVSSEVGEDPVGSAGHYRGFLFVSIANPWNRDVTCSKHAPEGLQALSKEAEKLGYRLMGMVPTADLEEGSARVIAYKREGDWAPKYDRFSFRLPTSGVLGLLQSLCEGGEPTVDAEPPFDGRELFVCTHGSRDLCCARFGVVAHRYLTEQVASRPDVRVYRCSHTGGHRFAPTLIDLPHGVYWGRMDEAALSNLLNRGTPSALQDCFRGWSGSTPRGQIVDRAMWLERGWSWLDTSRQMEVVGGTEESYPVQLRYRDEGGEVETVISRVERRDTVETLLRTGDDSRMPAHRYRVVDEAGVI
ncbi:MAG: hypothetical protein CMH54_14520 [Myxococcales bacterium]|nr:hypothetical protein [Myxococcales bacterium]